jgi:hypothetical protein
VPRRRTLKKLLPHDDDGDGAAPRRLRLAG